MKSAARASITAWLPCAQKARFAALAESRDVSESKLLGALIDAVLANNPVDLDREEFCSKARRGDRITLRLRTGECRLLRSRATARGMKYTTYAASLIRSHLRANPPMPLQELAVVERSLGEVSALARGLSQLARDAANGGEAEPGFAVQVVPVLQTVERFRVELRALVKANVMSWEAPDAEADR